MAPTLNTCVTVVAAILCCAAPVLAGDGTAVANPLRDVPAGQIVVVHIPEAARVAAAIDRVLEVTHQDAAGNPLRREIAKLLLHQELRPDGALTVCIGPPVRLGGAPVRTALLARVDAAKVTGGNQRDASGIVHRDGAPAVMVLADGTVAVGDAEGLPAVAGAPRGAALSVAAREAIVDADVLVRLDLRLLRAQHEATYRAGRAALIALAAKARRDDADAATIAALEERLRAADRFWARAGELVELTLGLIITEQAVDVQACLATAPGSSLARAAAGHPPLVGDLTPPLPAQEFAALAYASFDAEGLAGLLQWLTDMLVDSAVAFRPDAGGMGPAEIAGLQRLFGEYASLLGGRSALVMPIPGKGEPVLQADGVVQLAGASRGADWRGRLPSTLDGLVYLARVWLRSAEGDAQAVSLRSSLDPSSPRDTPPVDRWHLDVRFAPPAEGAEGHGPAAKLVSAVLEPQGLTLWNTAAGQYAYWTAAPTPSRIEGLMTRNRATRLGRAGDDEQTAEALRHVLRRPNAVAVFSPGIAAQLVSIAVLRRFASPEIGPLDVPVVKPRSLAAVSARLSGGSVSVRLYIPVTELEPLFSGYRTFRLLERPFAQPAPAPAP